MMTDTTTLHSTKLVMLLADVAGFARSFRTHDDMTMARFIDRFYLMCVRSIESHNGRIVKFFGDACHAIFDEDRGPDAVECILDLQTHIRQLGEQFGLDVDLGASLHCGTVIEGNYGASEDGQYDIIGREMNHTALMGRGPGLRISEPVYRQLVSGRRQPWRKRRPPVTYVYSPGSPTAHSDGE